MRKIILRITSTIFVLITLILLSGLLTNLVYNPKLGLTEDRWEKLFNFKDINIAAQTPLTAYVANSQSDCDGFNPCYTNTDGIDDSNGAGTGLRDAVIALNDGDEIVILDTYTIKDHTVLIDKNLTIRGYQNSIITYNGGSCSMPMLNLTSGGSLQELTINDGDCVDISRDLITISSPNDISVEHNTLQYGNRAINIESNVGSVTVTFNHITENQEYAVYQGIGLGTGTADIYANNIFNNRTGAQVNCNNQGTADHNFWGEEILATTSAEYCIVSDSKVLGAPILTSPDSPGAQAIRQTITGDFTYAFDDNIAIKKNSGSEYDLVIVNHGQGTTDNIPFLESGATPIVACSDFYDIFLAPGAIASDLVLSIKYDLNSSCISAIESADYCSQSDATKYPLWWYDPANDLTDGWDRTGQIPAGENPLNLTGQSTTCKTAENKIEVVIDSTGHPGITQDLSFTPFLAGLPIGDSDITVFNAELDLDDIVNIHWETGIESNISGYHVLRANSESGPYNRISPFIDSLGSNALYSYGDTLDSSEFNKNFYYKIEIINTYGETIRTHGPVSVLTSTPTPTSTPTRTLYPTRTPYPSSTPGPTRTATQYIYRSPTPYYRPGTSTPYGTPTQVRTDLSSPTGPSPTLDQTSMNLTETSEKEVSTSTQENTATAQTPSPTGTSIVPSSTPTQEETGDNETQEPREFQWLYLFIGVGSGLGLLGIASFYLSKIYLP